MSIKVALRKESVDRNISTITTCIAPKKVALRKESVDRNTSIDNITQGVFKSLSARRAWIEMQISVSTVVGVLASLSARRAWIEISALLAIQPKSRVALRKESVDRNPLFLLSLQRLSVALRKESVDRNTS